METFRRDVSDTMRVGCVAEATCREAVSTARRRDTVALDASHCAAVARRLCAEPELALRTPTSEIMRLDAVLLAMRRRDATRRRDDLPTVLDTRRSALGRRTLKACVALAMRCPAWVTTTMRRYAPELARRKVVSARREVATVVLAMRRRGEGKRTERAVIALAMR